jgi:myo-inositol-1(or 4)-monophosphatase
LNCQPIHVSRVRHIDDTLVATGFPSRRRHQNINVHFYYQLAMITHGVRRAGAAALDLAYVASGRLDGFWEFGLNPWDMAAGTLLIAEAGGKCSDMHGAPMSLRGPHLLADNGMVHEDMLEVFAEVFRREYRYPMPLIE